MVAVLINLEGTIYRLVTEKKINLSKNKRPVAVHLIAATGTFSFLQSALFLFFFGISVSRHLNNPFDDY